METALVVLAVAAAGLACPAMMWWQRRRGRDAACCMPARQEEGATELEELHAGQERLAARIAELDAAASRERDPTPAGR